MCRWLRLHGFPQLCVQPLWLWLGGYGSEDSDDFPMTKRIFMPRIFGVQSGSVGFSVRVPAISGGFLAPLEMTGFWRQGATSEVSGVHAHLPSTDGGPHDPLPQPGDAGAS